MKNVCCLAKSLVRHLAYGEYKSNIELIYSLLVMRFVKYLSLLGIITFCLSIEGIQQP